MASQVFAYKSQRFKASSRGLHCPPEGFFNRLVKNKFAVFTLSSGCFLLSVLPSPASGLMPLCT